MGAHTWPPTPLGREQQPWVWDLHEAGGPRGVPPAALPVGSEMGPLVGAGAVGAVDSAGEGCLAHSCALLLEASSP